jgi:hypothetical protein
MLHARKVRLALLRKIVGSSRIVACVNRLSEPFLQLLVYELIAS